MATTGLALWWPANRWLVRGFTVMLKLGSFRAVLDLHRVGGALLAILPFVVAATGIGLAGTGLWLWQRKRSLRRRAALQRQTAR